MKDRYDIEVNLSDSILKPFEWDNLSVICGIKLIRVSTKTFRELYGYNAKVNTGDSNLLISDTINSLVIKLDKDGYTIKRSSLLYDRDREICDEASKMDVTNIEYELCDKVKYHAELKEDMDIKRYVIENIEKNKSISKNKYIYYLCNDNIDGYSKSNLIKTIEKINSDKLYEIYEFLKKDFSTKKCKSTFNYS